MRNINKISFRIPLLIICFLLLILFIFDLEMRPIMYTAAKKSAENKFNTLFNECVNEYLVNNPNTDFYSVIRNEDGGILNVELNQKEFNLFKSELYKMMVDKYNKSTYITMTIPISNALNIDYISPSWFEITLNFKAPTTIDMTVSTSFTDAGINQTLQIVKLNVTADIYIIMSGSKVTTKCDYEYIVCENTIVGDVPTTYLDMNR